MNDEATPSCVRLRFQDILDNDRLVLLRISRAGDWMMSAVEMLPPVVYHYTSMETLLKIVESSIIWVTHLNYLNDASEREHCLDAVRKRIKSQKGKELFGLIAESRSDKEERDYMAFLPFVSSFSAERDSLTHWRSYCPQGNGVCIGFRTESLKQATANLARSYEGEHSPDIEIYFEAIQYLDSDDAGKVDEMIQQSLTSADDYIATHNRFFFDLARERYPIFWRKIEGIAFRTKHSSFAAEKEFRLMAIFVDGGSYYTRYRASRSTLVPYVEMKIPAPLQFLQGHKLDPYYPEQPYFIDSVTVGPTPHSKLSSAAVEQFFQGLNTHVHVYSSQVPYRDW